MSARFRPPDERKTGLEDAFTELRLQWAVAEANRCLLCNDPPCVEGCLANVDVKKFIRALKSRNLRSAVRTIREANFLVATCGRICPQAELCEGRCSSTDLTQPIAIGELQRFVGEAALAKGIRQRFPDLKSDRRAAIVGGGPGGLAAAYYLRLQGIGSDLFEKHDYLGGVMMNGIPEHRLPKHLLTEEIADISGSGTRIIHEEAKDYVALAGQYEAIVLACGLGPALAIDIPGAGLPGVVQADDLLERVNVRGEKPDYSGTTIVLGGGNTAMDAAAVALRLGSNRVVIVYRRSVAEMPAWHADRDFVTEEGVEVEYLLAPAEFLSADGKLAVARFQKTVLGDPDASGRRRPEPIPGAFTEIPCSRAVLALGNEPNFCWRLLGLDEAEGSPRMNPSTMETSRAGVFIVGDIASGGGTVVRAVADGRRAAEAIANRILKPE